MAVITADITTLSEVSQDEPIKLTRQEQRKIWNRNYNQTEHGREAKIKARIKFNENHPDHKNHIYERYHDKMQQSARAYYQKNRDVILAKARDTYHAKKQLTAT
jgi:hypothetical protein